MDKPALGFVALKSLKQGPSDPDEALAEIRRIYFKTTRKTIDHDLAHAIELLKRLPNEESRERATVFMQGLSEMQREWQAKKKSGSAKATGHAPRPGSGRPERQSRDGGTEPRSRKKQIR